jgi:hypothetical protein
MKRRSLLLVLGGILLPSLLWAQSEREEQRQTIRKLGELNAIALNCDYPAETMRMKQALINTIPKRRGLGQLFDDSTHESFLNYIQQGTTCPEESELQGWIDNAITALKQAYKAN